MSYPFPELLGVFALAVAGTHATLVAPNALQTTDVDAPIRDLPESFDGYTIAVLADLHQLPFANADLAQRAIAIANAHQPDLTVLLGDYGASEKRAPALSRRMYARAFERLIPALRTLSAPDGVFAVIGNHDHLAGVEAVRNWLEEANCTVLLNTSRTIHRGSDAIRIAGVDDAEQGRVDLRAGVPHDATELPTVVLSHHPDAVLHLAPECRVDLVLAGHTHGGQVVIPGLGAPITMSRVCGRRSASGWVTNTRAPLFVSRGVGAQIPIRFWCPPEVVIVRLRRA